MKHKEIERLKEICEKEGFQLDWDHIDHSAIIIREKKDPWEGVEFVECLQWVSGGSFKKGVIYPMSKIKHFGGGSIELNGQEKDFFKPSTETAYVDQLKKEAFERFGEIKIGDRFESATGGENTVIEFEEQKEWDYFKKFDQFFYKNVEIYCSGKWGKKLPERVKVKYTDGSSKPHNSKETRHEYRFLVSGHVSIELGTGDLLAKCLEDYLNKEAGI